MTTEYETSETRVGDIGGPRDAPAAPFTGTARFEVVRELGAGGMGVVYLARDRERGEEVALKTLARLDAGALYRFKHEFRALADLSHPNLVELGELICDHDRWFFTMTYVDGVDFVRHARPHGARRAIDAHAATRMSDTLSAVALAADPAPVLPAPAALGVDEFDEPRLRAALVQLVAGLAALHDAGMVHRDIKPANVLCRADGRVSVLDFGLAADYRARAVEDGATICGTPDYMAPEQVALLPVGPPADWYAVGVMLFEVLTGALPFAGAVAGLLWQKLHAAPPPLPPGAPPDLAALCADLLRRDPAARPTAAQILARLHAAPAPPDDVPQELAFVGRARELAELARLLAASREAPRMVVVSGESGLGKTALVQRFLADLPANTLVLHGRCFERESVPYKAFDGAVDAISSALLQLAPAEAAAALPDPASLAALRRVFPVLSRVPAIAAADVADSGNLIELRWRAFRGLRSLLAWFAARAPLVVCIDDLHWADADSLVLLAELLAPTADPPRALFLATSRTRVALPGAAITPDELPLVALSAAESERLVAALARDRDEAAEIAREARGHPLFIRELCVRPHGAVVGSVEDALYARVQAQDPAARELVAVIAVAGEPVAQAVAVRAAGLAWHEGAHCVAALRKAHLCRTLGSGPGDPVEPYHDRVRQAVLAHLEPARVTALARGLAELLEQSGVADSNPSLLVQLFAASGELARAARHAEHAAAAAARALAFDHAARLYRSALEYGDHEPARARRLAFTLAETLGHAGRGADAAAVYLEVAAQAGDDRSVALRARAEAACHQLGCGLIDEGLATAAQVLGTLGAAWPDSPRRALARLLWHRLRLGLRGLEFRERPASAVPEALLVRLDTFDQIATNVGAIDPITAGAYQAYAVRLALDAGERGRIVRALAKEACFIAVAGVAAGPRARAVVERVRGLALPGQPEHAAWAATAAGIVAFLTGAFVDAYPHLAEAERRFTAGPVRHFAGLLSIRLFRLNAARQLGAFAEIRRSLDAYLRDAVHRGDRHAENTLTRAQNLAWLIADEPDEARRRLAASTWAAEARGLHMQHLYDLLARVDLALYTADPAAPPGLLAELDRLARSSLARAQSNRCFIHHAIGRLALALAESGEAARLALAGRAADLLAREHVPLATLTARLLRAGVAFQRRETGRAAALLEQVAAGSAGLELHAGMARLRLAELGRGDPLRAIAPLRREGVVDPLRLARALAPGFTRRT
ncbi:MAG: protein kinase [Myxococcales bacterium]|nr:protein kinase [Myxococcales bacterium]